MIHQEVKYCNICGKALIVTGRGREKLYCSAACSQKSKRQRRNEVIQYLNLSEEILKEVYDYIKERYRLSLIASDYLDKNPNIAIRSNEWKEYVKLRDAYLPLHYEIEKKYGDALRVKYGNAWVSDCYEMLHKKYN